jgi:hypothetical protein
MEYTEKDRRVKIIQGEDKVLYFRLLDEKSRNYFDITAATEITVTLPVATGNPIVKKLSLAQVVIISGLGGRFDVALAPTETIRLEIGSVIAVQVSVTVGGLITIIQIPEALNVIASLF